MRPCRLFDFIFIFLAICFLLVDESLMACNFPVLEAFYGHERDDSNFIWVVLFLFF